MRDLAVNYDIQRSAGDGWRVLPIAAVVAAFMMSAIASADVKVPTTCYLRGNAPHVCVSPSGTVVVTTDNEVYYSSGSLRVWHGLPSPDLVAGQPGNQMWPAGGGSTRVFVVARGMSPAGNGSKLLSIDVSTGRAKIKSVLSSTCAFADDERGVLAVGAALLGTRNAGDTWVPTGLHLSVTEEATGKERDRDTRMARNTSMFRYDDPIAHLWWLGSENGVACGRSRCVMFWSYGKNGEVRLCWSTEMYGVCCAAMAGGQVYLSNSHEVVVIDKRSGKRLSSYQPHGPIDGFVVTDEMVAVYGEAGVELIPKRNGGQSIVVPVRSVWAVVVAGQAEIDVFRRNSQILTINTKTGACQPARVQTEESLVPATSQPVDPTRNKRCQDDLC